MKRIIDAAALESIAKDIEHNCFMLGFTDEESAEDDLGFYIPRIKRAVYDLRETIKESEPLKEKNRK